MRATDMYAFATGPYRHLRARMFANCGPITSEPRNPIYPLLTEEEVRRIIRAYKFSFPQFDAMEVSLWNGVIFPKHAAFHRYVMAEDIDKVRGILADPARSDICYGFYGLPSSELSEGQDDWVSHGAACMDRLLGLAVALGVRKYWHPEHVRALDPVTETPDAVVAAIQEKIGSAIDFPAIHDCCIGLATAHGVVNQAAVHAIYIAHRMANECSDRKRASVVEIGAGLGQAAYYARRFGLGRYTIVDIPVTAACQAYYLMSTLGSEGIALAGETQRQKSAAVRILSPNEFFALNEIFDVAVNVDSITEMHTDSAQRYLAHLQERASVLISINHEANDFSFIDLCRGAYAREPVMRAPYWLRRGYVEEHIRFRIPARRRVMQRLRNIWTHMDQATRKHGVQSEFSETLPTIDFVPNPAIVAAGSTPSNDGYLRTGGVGGTGVFAISATNVGATGEITVRVQLLDPSIPLTSSICETDPNTGQCKVPPVLSVTRVVDHNEITTWTVFVTAHGAIAADKVRNRMVVEFVNSAGNVRGSISIGITTQ